MSTMIRKADLNDVVHLAKLYAQLGYITSPEHIAGQLVLGETQGTYTYVAEKENKVVAAMELHYVVKLYRSEPSLHVNALIVEENYRCQKIGGELMAFAENWAIERRCGYIELCSKRIRQNAHRFYENLGYTDTTHRYFRKYL